jgi:hypothetical protein
MFSWPQALFNSCSKARRSCPLAGQWYICLPAIIWGLMHLKRPMLWLCIAIIISLAVRFVALAAQTL